MTHWEERNSELSSTVGTVEAPSIPDMHLSFYPVLNGKPNILKYAILTDVETSNISRNVCGTIHTHASK